MMLMLQQNRLTMAETGHTLAMPALRSVVASAPTTGPAKRAFCIQKVSHAMKRRRSPRIDERLTPCQCCGYPVSQRHHLSPINRYGENHRTVYLCANCHEAFHVFEQGWIDQRAGRKNTRSMRIWSRLYYGLGGENDPRVRYLNELVEQAELHQAAVIPLSETRYPVSESEQKTIRRGDLVLLSDGKIVRVVSTVGGYIHTTAGTYGPWQVTRIGKGHE
jgi:hypothetical protein